MKLLMFVVRDRAAEAFLQPMFFPNVATCLRAFRDAVNEEGHVFKKNVQDYSLYKIGEFDDVRGLVECGPEPEFVVSGIECIRSED